MRIGSILLTTDLSSNVEHTFQPACDLARRTDAVIDLVHVLWSYPPAMAEYLTFDLQQYSDSVREKLRVAAQSEVFEGVVVHPCLLEGEGPEAICDFQKDHGHDLIYIATHGRRGQTQLFLGSFVGQLVRLAECPVFVSRLGADEESRQIRTILFPHDFSEPAQAALGTVKFFAQRFDARIVVLHVLSREFFPAPDFAVAGSTAVPFCQYAEDSARDRLKDFVATCLAGYDATFEVCLGQPALEIARKAEVCPADLVIMSTHGCTGLRHALLGSTAERVVQLASCSVMTVRPEGAAAERGNEKVAESAARS